MRHDVVLGRTDEVLVHVLLGEMDDVVEKATVLELHIVDKGWVEVRI